MLINEGSLSATIDAISVRLASGQPLPEAEQEVAVGWLLARQTRSGRSAGLFESFPGEFELGVRLFTGERLRTRTAMRSVLTLESARILCLLGDGREDVRDALSRTAIAMDHACFAASHCVIGECAHSSIAYLRDAAADRSGARRKWIERHLTVIQGHRDGGGRWRRFPFYYTLLALLEVGTPAANAELEYAHPACRRVIGRSVDGDQSARRKWVLEKALGTDAAPLHLL